MDVWRWAAKTLQRHRKNGYKLKLKRGDVYLLGLKALKNGCPLCGCELIPTSSDNCQLNNEVSLDVINPKRKVLDRENCRVLCCACNNSKANGDDKTYIERCVRVAEKHGGI